MLDVDKEIKDSAKETKQDAKKEDPKVDTSKD